VIKTMRVVQTPLTAATLTVVNAEGKFVVTELARIPVDRLYEELTRAAVVERRRQQLVYPRLTPTLVANVVSEG
jgi:hypothetical protein